MLLVIAHHYVVNSGLLASDGPIYGDVFSIESTFLLIFGAFGKIGINCFILVTGYFMCKSNISLIKYLKLYAEIVFYNIVIGIVFFCVGYEKISILWLLKTILPFSNIEAGFTDCFMAFYLLIPFLNILIHNMTERQHVYVTFVLLVIYTGLATLNIGFGFSVSMNYVTWFCVMYLVASYIRLYPKMFFSRTKFWGIVSLACIGASILSIMFCRGIGIYPYYFLVDVNKILAVITAISVFLFFVNIRIQYNVFINLLGASTFGVLLIHANSNAMRQWLWKDLLNNVGAYSLGWFLPIHAMASVLGVFIVCSGLDLLRIRFLETPFLQWLSKVVPIWEKKVQNAESKIWK